MDASPDEPWIWTSGPVAADQRLGLVAVVVNPSDREFHYGVSGTVERGEPDGWARLGTFASSLDGWGGLGRIATSGRLMRHLIGLGAAAHSTGEAEHLDISGLAAGRYRLTHQESHPRQSQHQRAAVGTFVVAEPADNLVTITVTPADRTPPGRVGDHLTVRPALLPAHRAATVSLHLDLGSPSIAERHLAAQPEARGQVHLREWTDDGWGEPALSVPIQVRPIPGFDSVDQFTVLPPLADGAHQLSYPRANGHLTTVIWVSDDLPPPHE